MIKRLAIVTTHPIQYNAPIFKMLNERNNIDIKVFYTWGKGGIEQKYDPGFGKIIEWDIPLLVGYDYQFEENISRVPGSHHYSGIDNPFLISNIEKWSPHAILVFGWNFKSHLKALKYFKKKLPVFFRGDSTLLDPAPFYKKIVKQLALSKVYKNVDKAFYTGTHNKNYFKKLGLKEGQLVYAPHAIDNDRFADGVVVEKRANEFREKMEIAADEISLLFAGKFEQKKNPFGLIDAFIECGRDDLHLLLVGDGLLKKEIGKKIKSHKNIHVIPFQNQQKMPEVYRWADVFVLPSIGPGETWGLAINEAMASGSPVIATDKCGCAVDLIDEGKNGWIVVAGNNESLVQILKGLDKKKLPAMGAASLEKIKGFSFERICEALENSMQSL